MQVRCCGVWRPAEHRFFRWLAVVLICLVANLRCRMKLFVILLLNYEAINL